MYGSLASSSSEKHIPLGLATHNFENPRRSFSLPTIKIPFSSSSSSSSSKGRNMGLGLGLGVNPPLLPLSLNSPGRSTARRISYGIKNRASHHALSLTVGGLFALALLLYISLRETGYEISQFNNGHRTSMYSRGSSFSDEEHQHRIHLPDAESDNGVSLLLLDEEELIAEDDLFWDSYKDPEPLTAEEAAAEAELIAHRQDVLEHDRAQSLRAIVWWLAEGGIIPSTWEVPTKQYLRKIGGRGVERLLADIDNGEENDEIFDNGWADFAKKRYRIVVFSKSHCPYSKKAKSILGEYRLSPAPFIIELDQRSDMDKLQTLLQRLTGRRTVPNTLLDFASIGGSDDITLLHAEGGLQRKFEDMEVVPGSHRRRIKRPVQPPQLPAVVPVPAPDVPIQAVDPAELDVRFNAEKEAQLLFHTEDVVVPDSNEIAFDAFINTESDVKEPPAKRAKIETLSLTERNEDLDLDLDLDIEWEKRDRDEHVWEDQPRARANYNGHVLV